MLLEYLSALEGNTVRSIKKLSIVRERLKHQRVDFQPKKLQRALEDVAQHCRQRDLLFRTGMRSAGDGSRKKTSVTYCSDGNTASTCSVLGTHSPPPRAESAARDYCDHLALLLCSAIWALCADACDTVATLSAKLLQQASWEEEPQLPPLSDVAVLETLLFIADDLRQKLKQYLLTKYAGSADEAEIEVGQSISVVRCDEALRRIDEQLAYLQIELALVPST